MGRVSKNINTYNESSLHNTLKVFYAEKFGGETEVESEGHIYDILCPDGQVIEIQTKGLSKLASKIKDALDKGHKVRLVYPLVYRTRIILTDEQGKLISNRLSPKKGCIYDIFRELTGLTDILLNKKFTLEVVTINMIEHRVRTGEPVQTANKSRRFRRNWLKVNKRLDEILETKTFHTAKDYTALLPPGLPQEFCAKDIAKTGLSRYAHLILWVLVRIPVIEQIGVKNRSRYYVIK
ncbi:MAG: hypothetical protein IKR45_06205 [Treponema sp.]|nr:hypothetical protein [Treponema sp.]